MRRVAQAILDFFSSVGTSAALIILLGLLTWLGTLEQVDHGLFDVQKKYFESFWLVHHAGPIPIPLPGASLVLGLLFVNLVVGGMLRLRRGSEMIGIFITHLGILFLILAGFIKWKFSDEGHVTLFEGQSKDHYDSYYHPELVVTHVDRDGRVTERVVPEREFRAATEGKMVKLPSQTLPFDLEMRHYASNSKPLPKGPMFDVDVPVEEGLFLRALPRDSQAESNIAGVHVTVRPKDGSAARTGWLWALESGPLTVEAGGETYYLDLRKQRFAMPFTVVLDDFKKVDHPRTTMAKSFSSDVTVIENGTPRPVTISMNQPLRDGGLVLYQASWGPSNARPGDALFSTLAVVRNPADQYPLYATLVITAGLLIHFGRKLWRFVRREVKTA